jgi:hypothetical protein
MSSGNFGHETKKYIQSTYNKSHPNAMISRSRRHVIFMCTRYEVLVAVKMLIIVFRVVMPFGMVGDCPFSG